MAVRSECWRINNQGSLDICKSIVAEYLTLEKLSEFHSNRIGAVSSNKT